MNVGRSVPIKALITNILIGPVGLILLTDSDIK